MTLRTVTYKVNFDLAGVKGGSKSMQVTLKTMEQDAKRAGASMEQLAKTIGSEYGAKTTIAIDDTKTLSATMRQQAREVNRTQRNFQQLTREYQHMSTRMGQTSERQERLNALFRLGAGATLSQRKEVVRLVTEYQRLRSEATKTQGSLRGLRGQAQNVGFQLQDIAVQAQMGTNALVILGQQGSQLAAGFGPTGALVGAAIAVVSAITFAMVPSLKNAGNEIEDLSEKIKEFSKTALLTKNQAAFLEDQELNTISDYKKRLVEAEEKLKGFGSTAQDVSAQALQILRNVDLETPEGLEKYSKLIKTLNRDLGENQVQVLALIDTLKRQIKDSESAIESYKLRVKQTGNEQDNLERSQERNRKSNERLLDSITRQAEELNLLGSEILTLNRNRDLATLAEQKATDAQIEGVRVAYDAIIANAQYNEELQQQKKDKAELARTTRENTKAEEEYVRVLARYTDEGRLEQLRRQKEAELSVVGENADAVNAIEQHYARERLKINGTVWQQYAVQVQEAIKSTDEIMIQSVDRFAQGFGAASASIVLDSQSPADAIKNLFDAGLRSMLNFFGEWAAQKLLIWTLDKTLGATAQTGHATAMGFNTSAKVSEAGLNAFAATAAIPIIGPALAPAAAAAAIAATSPLAAAATAMAGAAIGVHDKGGIIPAGGAGIVAEIGDELVGGTMVYNGSPNSLSVTGREQTARQSGGGVSIGNITVNSSGNASPDAIARAMVRALERKNKRVDNAIFDSTNRGSSNRGKRFNA